MVREAGWADEGVGGVDEAEPGVVEPPLVGGEPLAGGCVGGTTPTTALRAVPDVVWNDARSARPPMVAMMTVTMRRNNPPQNSKRSKWTCARGTPMRRRRRRRASIR